MSLFFQTPVLRYKKISEVFKMTSEDKVDKLTEKYTDLHTVVNVLANKVDATNNKVDNLISEMRDRDNQRAEDIREIRQSVGEMGKNVRNISYTTIAAIGAMVITVLLNLPKG